MKMSAIVLGALVVSVLLRRRSAALRHWVLAVGVVCAAAMPLLTAAVPAWPLPFGTPTTFTSYENPFRDPGASLAARPLNPAAASAGTAPAATASRAALAPGVIVQFVWLAGVAVGLGVLLTGVLRLAWLAAHARRISHGRWHVLAEEISRGYRLERPVVLLQSSHPSLLVTWGLVRPKIVLPSEAEEWTDERVRVVLSHELAHIRRGDWIVQLFAELLRAFYWFNPLFWVACRRLRLESEHACDDEVMRRGVDGADYATHLIELARALNQRRHMWVPAPAMARPSSLERRVLAMLNKGLDRGSLTRSTRAAIVALLFAVTTAVAAAQSSFVAFTGRVTDEQQLAIKAVSVTLINQARESKYEVKTNADGRFEFIGLPAGEYSLEATGTGFQPLKDVLSVAGQNLQRNYGLKLGTLQETIRVRFDPNEAPANDPARDTPTVGKAVVVKPTECAPSSDGGRIIPPRKIRDASPYYPSSLRGVWTEGTVKMQARIGLDGYVSDVRIIGDPQPDLALSAVAALREWQYTQTLLNCAPAEVTMDVTVNFERRSQTP